jgi:hypothetical protein
MTPVVFSGRYRPFHRALLLVVRMYSAKSVNTDDNIKVISAFI